MFLFNDDVCDATIKEKKANEIFPVCLLRIAAMRRYVATLITSISCTDHMTAHALITWMIIH